MNENKKCYQCGKQRLRIYRYINGERTQNYTEYCEDPKCDSHIKIELLTNWKK